MYHIQDAGKFFLNLAAFLWKEDLTPLLGESRFTSKPCWSPTDLFAKLSTFGQNFFFISNLSSAGLSFSNLFIANLFPPLATSHTFADRHYLSPASPSLDNRSFLCQPHHCQPHSPLPTSLAVSNLTCWRCPHSLWNSPMNRSSLGISLDKTPKFLFLNLVDLSSS